MSVKWISCSIKAKGLFPEKKRHSNLFTHVSDNPVCSQSSYFQKVVSRFVNKIQLSKGSKLHSCLKIWKKTIKLHFFSDKIRLTFDVLLLLSSRFFHDPHYFFRCAKRDMIYSARYYWDWDSSACSPVRFLSLSVILFHASKCCLYF